MNEHPVITLIRSKLSDPSQPFTIIAGLTANPGSGDAVATAIIKSGAVRLTRAEPGCLAYEITRDAAAPDRFVAYESWHSIAALESHLATPHFAAVGAALAGLIAAPPEIRVLTPVA